MSHLHGSTGFLIIMRLVNKVTVVVACNNRSVKESESMRRMVGGDWDPPKGISKSGKEKLGLPYTD